MTVERRPISARDWRFSRACADWLARRNVSPNGISLFGMVAAIVGGAALAVTRFPSLTVAGFLIAAVMMQVRLLCNMFDGMVAISQHRASKVGELFNEIPDRISDAAFFVGAGYAAGGDVLWGLIAAWLAVFVAYVRVAGRVAGANHEYCGPMAKPHRMHFMTAACLFAAFAPAGIQPSAIALPGRSTIAAALAVVIFGEVVTVVRRLKRIAATLRSQPNE